MHKSKNYVKMVLFALFLMATPSMVWAGPEELPEDPGTPIDGGISLLIAAGTAYGAMRLRNIKTVKRQDTNA